MKLGLFISQLWLSPFHYYKSRELSLGGRSFVVTKVNGGSSYVRYIIIIHKYDNKNCALACIFLAICMGVHNRVYNMKANMTKGMYCKGNINTAYINFTLHHTDYTNTLCTITFNPQICTDICDGAIAFPRDGRLR